MDFGASGIKLTTVQWTQTEIEGLGNKEELRL